MKLTSYLQKDVPASIVVFLVALPLCLGIALASGASPFAGLIAGILGGIVVGSASGSHISVSGPAAGLTFIVASAINDLGSFESFLVAVLLAGVFQLALGFLRAGKLGYYFPYSTIKGMLAAIGVTLILNQIGYALGLPEEFFETHSLFNRTTGIDFSTFFQLIESITVGAVIICILSLSIILGFEFLPIKKKGWLRYLPASLFAVLASVIVNQVFKTFFTSLYLSENHLVDMPVSNDFSEFLSQFTFPDVSAFTNLEVYGVAIIITLVASIETLLSIEAGDQIDPYRRISPTSRELKAQGLGNFLSGLIGGIPITAVIVRSSVNVEAGARTKLSAVFHGFLLLFSAIFIPRYLNLIPLSALAAILFVVGFKLTHPRLLKAQYKKGKKSFYPFITTFVCILLFGLLQGIAVGFLVALLLAQPWPIKKSIEKKQENRTLEIRLLQPLNFLHKAYLASCIEKNSDTLAVRINTINVVQTDPDILSFLNQLEETARREGLEIEIIREESQETVNSPQL